MAGTFSARYIDAIIVLSIVGSIACSITVTAQPRLDVRSLPAPSKQFTLSTADTVGVKVGAAGPNVVWDFRQLVQRDAIAIQYMLPSEAPPEAATLFPTAQVAVRTGSRFEFFRTEGTMFRMLGAWTPTSSLTSGTANPYDTRPVELTFGGQHVDQYKAVLTSQADPQLQQRAGTHTITYDGFGRLQLQNGEVTGVARTKTVTRTTDTARYTSPTPRVVITTTDIESYRWLQPVNNVPWVIVNFTTIRVTTNGQPVSTTSAREVLFRDTTNSTGVEESSTELNNVYPNPARAGEDVYVSGIASDVISADLVDMHGDVIGASVVRIAPGTMRVALGGLAAASYTLVLRTAETVHVRRIVVLPQ